MIRSFKSITTAAMLLVTALVFTGCEGEFDDLFGEWSRPTGNVNSGNEKPSGNIAVTSITLDETSLEKKLGDVAVTLTATVKPDDATDKTVTWTSEDPAVASVSNGLVSILGEGTTIITATANDGSGVKATCTVTVKIPGLLAGKFTINASGDQVRFSQGNLQAVIAGYLTTDNNYNYAASSWNFAEHQWDYIGGLSTSGNRTFAVGSTVDLFSWVGKSGNYNSYGLGNDINNYGNIANEDIKNDWGEVVITNGGNTPNFGWRTLSKDEWGYLIETRTTSSGIRYAKAKVNGKSGVILLPDDWDASYHALNSTDTPSANYTSNDITAAEWASDFEAHGTVFLPDAGYRQNLIITGGNYWSSTSESANHAYQVWFDNNNLTSNQAEFRLNGRSVRLVYDVK